MSCGGFLCRHGLLILTKKVFLASRTPEPAQRIAQKLTTISHNEVNFGRLGPYRLLNLLLLVHAVAVREETLLVWPRKRVIQDEKALTHTRAHTRTRAGLPLNEVEFDEQATKYAHLYCPKPNFLFLLPLSPFLSAKNHIRRHGAWARRAQRRAVLR